MGGCTRAPIPMLLIGQGWNLMLARLPGASKNSVGQVEISNHLPQGQVEIMCSLAQVASTTIRELFRISILEISFANREQIRLV